MALCAPTKVVQEPAKEEYVTDEEDALEYVEVEEKVEEKWDCESILSTYSNTENIPKLIVEKSNVKIKLSNKTGMPLGVLPTKPRKQEIVEESQPAENLGKARGEETNVYVDVCIFVMPVASYILHECMQGHESVYI